MPREDTQFPKGVSGNPGGRPKGRSISAALRRLMDDAEIGGKPLPPGETVADLLAKVIRKAALEGDIHFVRLLLDRTDGPVTQKVQVDDVRKSYDVVSSPDTLWQPNDAKTPGDTTGRTGPPSNSGDGPTTS